MNARRTCFVVQGFGEKTDFTDGRKLNLDASYQVIKEAVDDAGMVCIRADEVVKSGTIDIPMYEWIMKADLVIADLSTYNLNAAYELGVRYGMAPSATIIVAEEKFKNPFDFSHIVLHRYKHLGEDIGLSEARRFKAYLSGVIKAVFDAPKTDSPVYELLKLGFPTFPPANVPVAAAAAAASAPPAAANENASAKALLDAARAAIANSDFALAKGLLQTIHTTLLPNDPYVLHQLALATYKSKQPDPITALREADHLLTVKLNAENTNDPETLGLLGAVQKRLWDKLRDPKHLDAAIGAYRRGYNLKQDYYNGINLAFLYNERAAEHETSGLFADAVADFVLAQRVRREIIPLCESALAEGPRTPEDRYWILATLWEAAVGLEDATGVAKWQPQAEGAATAKWMLDDSTLPQLARLTALLAASPLKHLAMS
jgi:hypothetical protein